jgi:hypothetical protein
VSFLAAFAAAPAEAAKTDVIVLRNGDRITGEVEQLERGRLRLSTDDLGTVEIEWDKIVSLSAQAPFDVDDLRGNRYLGTLEAGPQPGELLISWKDAPPQIVRLVDVVRMRRLETSFWGRLDGSLDVGASYTSASALFNLDLAATLGWERPGYEVSSDASSTFTSQPEVEDTQRGTLSVAYARRFPKRYLALVQGQLEQNRELGFDLRSSLAGGGGRHLIQSRRDKLLAGLGLSVNREKPLDQESRTNFEAMALLSYDRFAYDFPKVDVSIAIAGFASLNEGGRYRLEADFRLKRELVKDFYATLRGYESYDRRPPTEGAPNSDYGVTFALGWSF